MSMISLHAPWSFPIRETARAPLARAQRRQRLLLAAGMLLIAASYQLSLALQTPAQSIKSALTAAADEAAALPWNRNDQQVQHAIGQHFSGHDFRLETARFPAEVSVVLAGLDRETCIEARQLAHRIEGDVVIALDGYGSTEDCQAHNTMTWRILP